MARSALPNDSARAVVPPPRHQRAARRRRNGARDGGSRGGSRDGTHDGSTPEIVRDAGSQDASAPIHRDDAPGDGMMHALDFFLHSPLLYGIVCGMYAAGRAMGVAIAEGEGGTLARCALGALALGGSIPLAVDWELGRGDR